MASLLESILKSAASGGVKQGNLGGLDLDEIIKSVGGQVARKQSQGVDIGDILGSVLVGQQKQTAPQKSGVDIGDILGSVLGGQQKQTAPQKSGVDIGDILGSVLGGQQKQAPKKSGVDIGDVLGSVLGGQKQTQTKQTGGIDLGSILGSVLGGGSASGGGISDIAKSVINVLGMASGSLKK